MQMIRVRQSRMSSPRYVTDFEENNNNEPDNNKDDQQQEENEGYQGDGNNNLMQNGMPIMRIRDISNPG